MSRGFHSENELYSMQNSITVGYFDHYCVKHHISVEQALQHYLVQMAGMQYKEQSKINY